MKLVKQKELQPQIDRYELKYTIPEEMVEPIIQTISACCFPDKYTEHSDDGYYTVNSLYFDTPDFQFLQNRLEQTEDRFNMRIRSYGNGLERPYFLEIKQKKAGLVRKLRNKVEDNDWQQMFIDPDYCQHLGKPKRELFLRLAYSYLATPKVLTQYRRRAYISEINEYARVTFDKELRYQAEDSYNLVPNERLMIPFDDLTLFDPGCDMILELKCYSSKVPTWMIDLIKTFNLKRRSFSKYTSSVKHVINNHQYNPF